jgi:hypothetical protein
MGVISLLNCGWLGHIPTTAMVGLSPSDEAVAEHVQPRDRCPVTPVSHVHVVN